jgi:hypothetical protein
MLYIGSPVSWSPWHLDEMSNATAAFLKNISIAACPWTKGENAAKIGLELPKV